MISYVEGQILYLEAGHAVVKANGIGYHILLNKKTLENILDGQNVAFFIHTHLREDAIELYGFHSRVEKQIFLLLIGVSGIGPKLAQSILSALSPHDLVCAIIDKDINRLSSVPGIGKKTAERVSLELKEKAAKMDLPFESVRAAHTSMKTSLEQAIRNLGYTKSQSDRAILKLDENDLVNLPLEDLIKKTLNALTGTLRHDN